MVFSAITSVQVIDDQNWLKENRCGSCSNGCFASNISRLGRGLNRYQEVDDPLIRPEETKQEFGCLDPEQDGVHHVEQTIQTDASQLRLLQSLEADVREDEPVQERGLVKNVFSVIHQLNTVVGEASNS